MVMVIYVTFFTWMIVRKCVCVCVYTREPCVSLKSPGGQVRGRFRCPGRGRIGRGKRKRKHPSRRGRRSGGKGIPGNRQVRISVRFFMPFMARVTLAIVRAKSFRIVRIRCANRPCNAAQPVSRLRNIKLRAKKDTR